MRTILRFSTFILAVSLIGLIGCKSSDSARQVKSKEPNATLSPASAVLPVSPEAATRPALATASQLPAGVPIPVSLEEVVDSDNSLLRAMVRATVAADVTGNDGKLALPKGSSAVLSIAAIGKREGSSFLSLALYQVTVNDKSFVLSHPGTDLAVLSFHEEAAQGSGHRSVHLQQRDILKFVLREPYHFNR